MPSTDPFPASRRQQNLYCRELKVYLDQLQWQRGNNPIDEFGFTVGNRKQKSPKARSKPYESTDVSLLESDYPVDSEL